MNRVDSMNRGIAGVKALDSLEIPSLEGKVGDEEWAIRVPAEVIAPFLPPE